MDSTANDWDGNWAAASLTIASDTVTIKEITATLQIEPTYVHLKGTPHDRRNPHSKLRTHNVWNFDSGLESDESFVEHIDMLLNKIELRQDALEALAECCLLDLYMGYGPGQEAGTVTLDHRRVARVARLPLSLTVDLSPPVPDDQDGTVALLPPESCDPDAGPSGDGHGEDEDQDAIDELFPSYKGWRVANPARRSNAGAIAVRGTRVSIAEITSLLALPPTPSAVDGSPRRQIDEFSRLAQEKATWVRESGLPRSAPPEDHLATLLATLQGCRVSALAAPALDASVELRLCYASDWGQGSLVIQHSDLTRLAALPVDLTIELVLPPGDVPSAQ